MHLHSKIAITSANLSPILNSILLIIYLLVFGFCLADTFGPEGYNTLCMLKI